jgi:DNA-directed RNA polymerase specialized sigma24 family protein
MTRKPGAGGPNNHEANEAERRLEDQGQRGNKDQIGRVWDIAFQYQRNVRLLATWLIGAIGADEADDVAQEAYLDLHKWVCRHPEKVEALLSSKDGVQRFLIYITTCRARDLLRQRTSRRDRLTTIGYTHELYSDSAVDPVQHVTMEINQLSRIYQMLPFDQRVVHILHYHFGYTDGQIEKVLGANKNSIRSLAHRANEAIKRALRSGGGEPR